MNSAAVGGPAQLYYSSRLAETERRRGAEETPSWKNVPSDWELAVSGLTEHSAQWRRTWEVAQTDVKRISTEQITVSPTTTPETYLAKAGEGKYALCKTNGESAESTVRRCLTRFVRDRHRSNLREKPCPTKLDNIPRHGVEVTRTNVALESLLHQCWKRRPDTNLDFMKHLARTTNPESLWLPTIRSLAKVGEGELRYLMLCGCKSTIFHQLTIRSVWGTGKSLNKR
ncbi:hypothetical protein EDD16DRAFT_1527251 [Pisolithus croceorrhizus]|nr:hypothetical protein EDD16DRAFT_1527251 [Pisolithus croceorrhizus]KAI6105015.1 hypothetical protein EV401DRAFT_2200829 [Pisolithus croceorrhizus]